MLNYDVGNPQCVLDTDGKLYWFSRHYIYLEDGNCGWDLNKYRIEIDGIKLCVDIVGVGATGEVWVDDIELAVEIRTDVWQSLVGPIPGQQGEKNYSFEDSQWQGGNTFVWWLDPEMSQQPELFKVRISKDSSIFRNKTHWGGYGTHSCYLKSEKGRAPKAVIPACVDDKWKTSYLPLRQYHFIDTVYKNLKEHKYRIQAFLRTLNVDTGRMLNPHEWIRSGNQFISLGKYRGGAYQQWLDTGLPFDDGLNTRWKMKTGLIGMAAWNWNSSYPNSSRLAEMNFDPFRMLKKEVPWWNKT